MGWKERLIAGGMVLAALLAGWASEQQAYIDGYNFGRNVVETWTANCTIADAHAGRCFIPCGGDSDCVEKNGRDEY